MQRIAWATDIHFDFVKDPATIDAFIADAATYDALVISGDIGESDSFSSYLERIQTGTKKPVYFVLGNHDYYGSSIQTVREHVHCPDGVFWLPKRGVVELTPQMGMVGHGGWADGRYGDYARSPVLIRDYKSITDLMDPKTRLQILNALGDESARFARRMLPEALSRYEHVYFVTHVPPFAESCAHEGKVPDAQNVYTPHFANQALGDALREIMAAHPHRRLTVLCGHIHRSVRAMIADNLRAITGDATYGEPQITSSLALD